MTIQTDKSLKGQKKKQKIMQAAVITSPGEWKISAVPIPEPAADEVRVRMEGCGLCASDLPVWSGREWFSYPVEAGSPGHEAWGVVDAVGKNVKSIHPEYRVTGLFSNAYAEYDVAKETQVVELPETLRNKPFPGEPLGCAMNIFRRSGVNHHSTVAVIGTGWLGALLVQLSKHAGARVIALSRRSSSLENAKKFGADYTINTRDEENVVERVEEITGGDFCDCVIEAAGKQKTLDLAGKLAAVRGRLVIAGYHQDGSREVNMQLWNWRGLDVINAHERDPAAYIRGIREAIQYINRDILNPFPLFTHTFAQTNIKQAFESQRDKPEGFTKALIKFD